MKTFTRMLLGVYSFIIGIVSLASFIAFINQSDFNNCFRVLTGWVPERPVIYYAAIIVTLIFLIWSIILFFISIRAGLMKKAVGRRTSIGEIRITLTSVENIVLNVVKKTPGVKDVRTSVSAVDDSVSVDIRLVVFPDVNLPLLSEDIQAKVKKGIEDNAGITVGDVKVVIDNIFTGPTYKAKQIE